MKLGISMLLNKLRDYFDLILIFIVCGQEPGACPNETSFRFFTLGYAHGVAHKQ
jgi:hypothetical protein